MHPPLQDPFANSAFHFVTILDFLCLAAGTYLLLILHDRRARAGYLLTALGLIVLALQIVSEQLTANQPQLLYASETLSLAIAGLLLAWGTLALVEPSEDGERRPSAQRPLLIAAATVAALGTLVAWLLPFSEALRLTVMRASAGGGFVVFQNGLRVGVAAALVACTWITWERRVLGADLSRMFGVAYALWGGAIAIEVLPLWPAESSVWMGHIVWVLGSLFVGNALAVHVYRAERRALERQQRLRLVDRVATAAIAEPRLVPMVEAVTGEVSDLLDTLMVATYVVDTEDPDRLERVHVTGNGIDIPETIANDGDHELTRCLRERRPVRVSSRDEDGSTPVQQIAVPLTGLNEDVGVLFIALPPKREFTDPDMATLANVGTQLGVIMRHMVVLEEMRQARDRWRQTFDSITELVTVHDAEGHILLANSAALTFAGVDEDDAIGSTLPEVLDPESSEEQEELLETCVRTGASPGISLHRTRGRVHQVHVTPLRDDKGQVAGCVRVARDVTSRHRAEERSAQSERRYRELADNANDIIYTHDLEGNFIYVNPAAVEVLGYSQEQFSHLQFWDIVAPEALPRAREYVDSLIEGRPTNNQIDLRMNCEDGSVAVIQLKAHIARRAGQNEAVHGIARDVTAEKQLTGQLMQADRLASAGTLIAGIAHELNNPLTTIGGYAAILAEDLEDSHLAETANTIADEAERCHLVAKNLLHFARQTDDKPMSFDLNAVIRGVFDLRAYDLRAASITIETDLAEDLHEVVAKYGPIQQVIYNLIDNAYYALEQEGGGTVEVTTWNENDHICVRVADTGPGIPPNMRERIFEPFITTKPRGEGTGLGLSICRRIVHQHGGTVSAENREEGGASFTVRLPAEGPSATPIPEEDEVPAEPIAERVGIEGAHVLFIDDEPSLCSLVEEYLNRRGYQVSLASTGEEGLEKALADDFDAIVCDMRLPGISGEEVCGSLLEQRPDQADRIMVATGDILSPRVQEFFDRTGLPHIHKPFELGELENAIVRLASGEAGSG